MESGVSNTGSISTTMSVSSVGATVANSTSKNRKQQHVKKSSYKGKGRGKGTSLVRTSPKARAKWEKGGV